MKKRLSYVAFLAISGFLLASCAQSPQRSVQSGMTWSQAMRYDMKSYKSVARQDLQPYFRRAGVPYPPRKLAFLIFKKTKRFEVYAKDSSGWHYIRTFPVLAASGGPGPKLHEGDHQVPEGVYHIEGFNPKSRFDMSLHLNYPNAFDRKEAKRDHRTDLGGDIFIHGNHRSIGCVAIGNTAIQQIFPLVRMVGKNNVEVIIAPDDLRVQAPVYGKVHPNWLPQLYKQIRIALRPFPEPSA